jgi:hypothetical protein
MRVIQFEIPRRGRRVGVVVGDEVRDLTAARPEWQRWTDVFEAAQRENAKWVDLLAETSRAAGPATMPYGALLEASPASGIPFLLPPLDALDPHRVLISGTGLTHLGSMQSRDQMHAEAAEKTDEPQTDSAKMFDMGLRGGKPEPGKRGVAPEWFYKGNGTNLRGHRHTLEIPAFALDGGEEPELVGCYVIGRDGVPRRLGFALGNEWSDHATERINYLYLAPSKLRQCSVGPELVTDCDFQSIELRCTVVRGSQTIYDSGPLLTGEQNMSHSLANCEDHHFKYPQHRVPGDVHLHYFGTSKLSYSTRGWKYKDGDEVRIAAPGFSATLVNIVRAASSDATPLRVKPA